MERSEKIAKVIAKCRQRLASGKDFPDSSIIDQFPDLMPELGEELKKLRLIERARREVDEVDEQEPVHAPEIAPLPPPQSDAEEVVEETVSHGPAAEVEPAQESASFTADETEVRYFGDYELLDEIARGGMGVVYKARQVSLNRIVALKMILSGNLASEQDVQRFHAEAEAAANLDHPNIVPIYEVGEHDGQHYFSMGYVEGEGLEAKIRENPLSSKQAAEYLKAVAAAIDYAHQRGVLHRDIKPSNVLIDKNNQPKVTDFGLAKKTDSDSNLTATGQILGTPSYMPPEQAFGDHEQITPASDVYSLGALLYALITGRPPFQAETTAATLMQVINQEPFSPRLLNPAIGQDLETICLKCLEKDQQRRYETASELADELGRVLRGEPIVARPVSKPEQAWRWCKREPVVASLIGAVVLLLIGGIAISSSLAIVAQKKAAEAQAALQEKELAEEERRRAEVENDRKRAASLVEGVLTARAAGLPYAIDALIPLRDHALPILKAKCDSKGVERTQLLHAACALAECDDVRLQVLVNSIQDAPGGETANVVTALRHAEGSAVTRLKGIFDAEENASQRVRLATVLLHLGDTEKAQSMLALGPDPTERTAFIHGLDGWYGDLSDYATPLRETNDADFRSGLCLAVGRIPVDQVPADEQQVMEQVLLEEYQSAPGGATHSACDWALRQWNVALPAIAAEKAPTNRDWHVNTLGMTMVKIRGGSTKSFWISNREVSVAHFQRFMDDDATTGKPTKWQGAHKETSPTGEHPVQQVSWYDAVLFCNWLSSKEDLTPCYERTGDKERIGDKEYDAWRVIPKTNGYRLPTEADWEYACRARTKTEYCFGSQDSLLDQYAVYAASSAQPCGTKLPNGWGLFDMHGNVYEWVYNWYTKGSYRVRRGGSWSDPAGNCRSSLRRWNDPPFRFNFLGFRLAAVPSSQEPVGGAESGSRQADQAKAEP